MTIHFTPDDPAVERQRRREAKRLRRLRADGWERCPRCDSASTVYHGTRAARVMVYGVTLPVVIAIAWGATLFLGLIFPPLALLTGVLSVALTFWWVLAAIGVFIGATTPAHECNVCKHRW